MSKRFTTFPFLKLCLRRSILVAGVRGCQLRPRRRSDGAPRPWLPWRHQIPGCVTRPGCSPSRLAWINHGWAPQQPLGHNTKHKQAPMVSVDGNRQGWRGEKVTPQSASGKSGGFADKSGIWNSVTTGAFLQWVWVKWTWRYNFTRPMSMYI